MLPSQHLRLHLQPVLQPVLTLEVLSSVFTPFGEVKKMAMMMPPEGGLQAWVQFADGPTAAQVRQPMSRLPVDVGLSYCGMRWMSCVWHR